ncbi:YfiR family protein [Janthinobacterium fluminis]|uniref:YfiR family protein n=1 Tax=Janthinobacterium fluminis TaxID=2987524 RepID=A0ABT5K3T7_9BURK|nr:YfiR family protein [Janthinobacterium fluminis]MDC8759650.1 YfiR family protein [Janthinobacterium fluminis]
MAPLTRPALLPVLWLALLLALLGGAARAQAPGALERQVKAAYLYKFAGFVEWPDGSFARADSPLVIGVLGDEALAEQLEQSVAGRSANGRAVVVRRLRRGDAPAGLHILFIAAIERAAVQEALDASRQLAVLTVTETDAAHALGSMVSFVVADERLRFEVALKPLAAARIRISARMLAAAYKVQPGPA